MSFCNKKITNRGFMTGPFCPIYGVGALSVYFILRPLEGNYLALFFVGALLATTFEYLVARLMLYIFGNVWWDYHNKPLNYKGILCLESTMAWGLYTVLMFLFLQKFVVRIVNSYSYSLGVVIGTVIIGIIAFDMLFHLFREKKTVISE
jgi:uncharacterized membrane protein